MKVAIMQPYFFPYIGYFSLIENSDYFIYFDTPQYIRKGWINRNRILNSKGEVVYMTVPVKKSSQQTVIKEIEIDYSVNWKEKIRGQLVAYKKRAPYYTNVMDMINELFAMKHYGISELSIASIRLACERIGLELRDSIFSEMDLSLEEVSAPDEWALNIAKAIGAQTYINPPGGMSFFDRSKYEKEGIKLQFLQAELTPYVQRIGHFESGLSILDVMMFCSPDEIKKMCKNFTIL